jgi:hypothetical protein
MDRIKLMPLIFVVIYQIHFNMNSFGQNCSCISGVKNKSKGTEIIGGITNSKDFYSLLIQKEISYSNDSTIPRYFITVNAASKILFTDSILKTKGTIELKLLNDTVTYIENVTYLNNPLGYCCSLGFQAEVKENLIKTLSQNPIVNLIAKDILSTTFLPKRQKEQQTICKCLLIRNQTKNK